MAAYTVLVSREDQPIIERYLGALGDGGILVFPDAAEVFEMKYGKPIPDDDLIDYDFGGESDVMVDVMRATDHYCAGALLKHLGIEAHNGEEDSEDKI